MDGDCISVFCNTSLVLDLEQPIDDDAAICRCAVVVSVLRITMGLYSLAMLSEYDTTFFWATRSEFANNIRMKRPSRILIIEVVEYNRLG